MLVKFRISDDTWQQFLNKTDAPSETLRELVNSYLEGSLLDQVIGANEAAELWDLSPGYIKNLCAAGKIKAKNVGNTWLIDKTQQNPSQSSE